MSDIIQSLKAKQEIRLRRERKALELFKFILKTMDEINTADRRWQVQRLSNTQANLIFSSDSPRFSNTYTVFTVWYNHQGVFIENKSHNKMLVLGRDSAVVFIERWMDDFIETNNIGV